MLWFISPWNSRSFGFITNRIFFLVNECVWMSAVRNIPGSRARYTGVVSARRFFFNFFGYQILLSLTSTRKYFFKFFYPFSKDVWSKIIPTKNEKMTKYGIKLKPIVKAIKNSHLFLYKFSSHLDPDAKSLIPKHMRPLTNRFLYDLKVFKITFCFKMSIWYREF